MKKDACMTEEERKKCRKVVEAFSGLEEENIIVVEAGKLGFLRILCYDPPYGIDDVILYSDSKKLFDDLWRDWLDEQLQKIAATNPLFMELDEEDMFDALPEETQKELLKKRIYFEKKGGIATRERKEDENNEVDLHRNMDVLKDRLYELLNESDEIELVDVETDPLKNIVCFTIKTIENKLFELQCKEIDIV